MKQLKLNQSILPLQKELMELAACQFFGVLPEA